MPMPAALPPPLRLPYQSHPRRRLGDAAVYFEKIDGEGHLFQMGDDCQKKAGVTVHEVCLLDALCTNNDDLWKVETATGAFDFVCDYKGAGALESWPNNIAPQATS